MRGILVAAALLAAFAPPVFDAPRAIAQETVALDPEAVNECALAFLKALRQKDVGAALLHSAVPFIAEDAKILKTEPELRDYLTKMLAAQQDDSVLPNAVYGILDYAGSRAATADEARMLRDQVLTKADLLVAVGRDGFSRGVLLVKAKDGKPMVVGIGY